MSKKTDNAENRSLHSLVGLLRREREIYRTIEDAEMAAGAEMHHSRHYHAQIAGQGIGTALHYIEGEFGEHIDAVVAAVRAAIDEKKPNSVICDPHVAIPPKIP